MGVPVVVRLELAGQVRPRASGQIRSLVSAVAFADRDSGPRLGRDVHGSPDTFAGWVEPLGGWGEEIVGIVGTAGMPGFRAEEKVVRWRGVSALACPVPVDHRAAAGA